MDLKSTRDKPSDLHRQGVSDFESSYGLIPDRISCCGVTVPRNDLLTVIRPRSCVIDTPISAFTNLLNHKRVLILDTLFGTSLYSTMNRRENENHAEFLPRFYDRSFETVFQRIKDCEVLIIPLFNSNVQGLNRNHWGLAVLHKQLAILRVYDSLHSSRLFGSLIPHILQFANSITSRYELSSQEWPNQWSRSREVFSSQQGNGYYCGIFAMLNVFFVSRGIDRPSVAGGD